MIDRSDDTTIEMFLTPEQQDAYATFRQQIAEHLAGLKAQFQREHPTLRISYDVDLTVTGQRPDSRKPGTPLKSFNKEECPT